mmetsp:Transcript_162661/g.521537  ORF Transcript_162661/g.521537 Transcript_162661/m.521537 type:complete len:177 (+) Transcript_162661:62-592(+)
MRRMAARTLPRLVVCARTREYRRAALELVYAGDVALEIGCHEGLTSAILERRCGEAGAVLGVDRSRPAVAAAQVRFPSAEYPNLRFEVCDFPRDLPNGAAMPARGSDADAVIPFSVVFMDLGGDARLSVVLRALVILEELSGLRLLVVKSEALRDLHRRWAANCAQASLAKPVQDL